MAKMCFVWEMRVSVLATFLGLWLTPGMCLAQSWEKVYEQARPAIPVLLSGGGVCAAALVERSVILTAAHCVDRLRSVRVLWPSGKEESQVAEVVHLDVPADVAFLRLSRPVQHVRPLALANSDYQVKAGQQVATIGHPVVPDLSERYGFRTDSSHLISSGVVSRVNDGQLVVDVSVSPGNSGGPVFNSQGEIIGVTSKKLVGLMIGNIGYASSASTYREAWAKIRAGQLQGPVSVMQAKSSFDLGLAWERASWLPAFGLGEEARSLYWHMAIKDRLVLRFESMLSNQHFAFDKWGLGWKFDYEIPYLRVVSLIPLAEWMDVRTSGLSEKSQAFSLILQATMLPVWMKVSTYQLNSQAHTSLALGFDLF